MISAYSLLKPPKIRNSKILEPKTYKYTITINDLNSVLNNEHASQRGEKIETFDWS